MAAKVPIAGPQETEDASSILRTGPEADALRRRMERGARISRYVLATLGVITASAGLLLWITSASDLGLALGAFGGVLIALGIAQHLLYRRDIAHWPKQAFLWDDGIELVLRNGEVRGATWSDPDLVLQIVDRRAPPPANREYLLLWIMDSRVPPVEITEDGFERLSRVAGSHPLRISLSRRGARANAMRVVDIRALPTEEPANPRKGTELQKTD